MKKTTKVILSSALTMGLCASLIAGSTLAMFSSRSNVNVAITSGKVDVVASVDEDSLTAYSTVWNNDTMQYEEVEQRDNSFHAGGFYSYSAGALTFTNIAAGDAVEFKLNIENNSTLAIQYRVQLTVPEKTTSGGAQGDLVKEMQVSFDGGDPVTIGDESTIAQKWSEPVDASAPITTQPTVKISVPAELEGNQGESCLLHVGVYAVQLGTHTSDPVGTYKAYTANDLIRLIDSSNYHSKKYAGETIALGADIDLSTASDGGASTLSIALADTPATIAAAPQREDFYIADEFKGTFDGNGHKLSNFCRVQGYSDGRPVKLGYGKGAGLFASMDGATVKNLVLSNVTMKTNSENTSDPVEMYGFAGILAGAARNSTIENVRVENGFVGSTTNYDAKCVVTNGNKKAAKTKEEEARSEYSELPLVAYDKIGALFGWVGANVTVSNVNITLNQDATELTGNKLFGHVADGANVTYQGNVTVTCVPAAGMEEVLTFTQESHEPAPTVSVGSAEGLASLAQSVQSGRDFSGMTIALTGDIDLSEYALEEIGAFKGTIDGGEEGHAISGLDLKYFSKVASPVSLMSEEEAPTLKNVTLEFTQFTGVDDWKSTYAFATHKDGVTSDASFVNGEKINLENATIALVDEDLRYELHYDEKGELKKVAYIGQSGNPETGEGYETVIENQHIVITADTPIEERTFDHVKFVGDTYIWIQSSTTLKMTGCYADVHPARVGNNSRAAFITSNTEIGTSDGKGITFDLDNNTILSAQSNGSGSGNGDYYSAAIFSWAYTESSTFTNNRFGSEESTERYTYVCIKLMNFAENAYVQFTNNTIYGVNCDGFDLMQNNSRANTYTARFINNTVSGSGCYFLWVEANANVSNPGHGRVYVDAGVQEGEVYHGNNLNGEALNGDSFDPDSFYKATVPAEDISTPQKYEKYFGDEEAVEREAYYQYSFFGWLVTYNDDDLITGGTFAFGVDWDVDKLVSEQLAAEDNHIDTFNGENYLTTNRDGQIVLDSAADLVALNKYLAEAQSVLTLNVVVRQDINMTGVELSADWTEAKAAILTLNGQNHVIYGIKHDASATKFLDNTFFAHISNASSIKNLNFLMWNEVGSISSTYVKGTLENVLFATNSDGVITGLNYCYKDASGKQLFVNSTAPKEGDNYAGGAFCEALYANREQNGYQGGTVTGAFKRVSDTVRAALLEYLDGIFGAYLN